VVLIAREKMNYVAAEFAGRICAARSFVANVDGFPRLDYRLHSGRNQSAPGQRLFFPSEQAPPNIDVRADLAPIHMAFPTH